MKGVFVNQGLHQGGGGGGGVPKIGGTSGPQIKTCRGNAGLGGAGVQERDWIGIMLRALTWRNKRKRR